MTMDRQAAVVHDLEARTFGNAIDDVALRIIAARSGFRRLVPR